MAIIQAPPRREIGQGSGIAKLLELYLMKSIGAMFETPQLEAERKIDLLKEYGGEFTPEQAGLLESQINPKTGISGIIDKFRKPVSTGYTAIPGVQPKLDVMPIELGMNAEPGQIEAVVDPNAQTLMPNIPTKGGRQSILQSILRPTEGGTYRLPGRVERETAAFGKRAELEEAAKRPWRESEAARKTESLEATLQTRNNQIEMMRDWHEDMYKTMQNKIDEATRHNMASEEIARMKNELLEMKTTFAKTEAAWKEDVARMKAEAYTKQVEKIGQMPEKDVVKTFENEAIAQGLMKINPKTKAKIWKELSQEQKDQLDAIASQYGYGVNWKENQKTFFPNTWTPTIDYKTERTEKKLGEAGKGKTEQPKEKVSEKDLKKDLMKNGYSSQEADDYIKRAKEAGKL